MVINFKISRNYNWQWFKTYPGTYILLSVFGRTFLTAFISNFNILGNSSLGNSSIGWLSNRSFGFFFLGEVNLN